ncbi:hypothetical protein MAPG_10439 [Magnaporthiopsis poae ATCC 64411]|uniref:Protein kinase domain-containing protein n=1 Tax=Magnaporthiopsis poae (strain ATCC 64411 / 73-15) TaxID=644358 RepID=A0A0C4ECL0_MAGP6|nr:hypothetical protein MAPG_10439 [Magnaporthiopsis poae ATCC 64411]
MARHATGLTAAYIQRIKMEICQSNEAWVEKDGDLAFDHTKIILRQDDDYFYARVPFRENDPSAVDVARLDARKIIMDSVWPPADSRFTAAPDPLPADTYVKQPQLLHYDDTPASRNLGALMLGEIEACEVLRLKPHPNIARYLGCLTNKGRVTGLCFARYSTTLAQLLREGASAFDKHACFRGIEAGFKHMHALGLVHNDLNPSNIMFDGREPIIIDFDSCKTEGEPLGHKGGTFGWTTDDGDPCSRKENDVYALEKLRGILLGEATTAAVAK